MKREDMPCHLRRQDDTQKSNHLFAYRGHHHGVSLVKKSKPDMKLLDETKIKHLERQLSNPNLPPEIKVSIKTAIDNIRGEKKVDRKWKPYIKGEK